MPNKHIDSEIIKALESVLDKGSRAETPLKCDCGKMIARVRDGKIFLWCKQCRKEVELKLEGESHCEPRTDNRVPKPVR